MGIFFNLIAVFLFLFGLFGDIEWRNYNGEYVRLFITIIAWIFIFLSYGCDKFVKKMLKKMSGYGYINNKVIDLDNVPLFRDIPCDGDIWYAYVLIKLNNFKFKNGNILGAVILKWIKNNKISVRKDMKKNVIDLTLNPEFDDPFEEELFKMIYEASENGILEIKEFGKWAKNYDMRFLGLFVRIETAIINLLKKETRIYHRITEDECFCQYVMDDTIYDDSIKLYGFKKYLEDFSLMDNKEIKELHLWEDYLIFAALFGITDKVNKQLKELYPDIDEIDMFDLI